MADLQKIAWLAGIFDGEGCVAFRLQRGLLKVCLSIGMTSCDTMFEVDRVWREEVGVESRWSEQELASGKIIFRVSLDKRKDILVAVPALVRFSVTKKAELEAACKVVKLIENKSQQFSVGHFCQERNDVHAQAYEVLRTQIPRRYKMKERENGH